MKSVFDCRVCEKNAVIYFQAGIQCHGNIIALYIINISHITTHDKSGSTQGLVVLKGIILHNDLDIASLL